MPSDKQYAKWAIILVLAIFVPVIVAGKFPPPESMSPFESLAFLAWLSMIGGLAGYGLWKL
jgi:hypothetical protein